MTLAALIEEAKTASPSAKECRQQWRRLWPVVQTLRAQGFTYKQAVAWLVEKKEMQASETQGALNAFAQIATRHNRRVKSSRS